MKQKSYIFLLLSLFLFILTACNPGNNAEQPAVAPTEETPVVVPTEETAVPTEEPEAEVATDGCPTPQAGSHQLIHAPQGFCFLYPDNYEVFQGDDGSITLYVESLMNTEAPIATIRVEAMNGRSIQEIIPDYPSDADLATMSFLTIDLGQEMAIVLDILPGQDTNRHVIAVHEDRLYDLMIARIGPEYGEVGEQAEALFQAITSSFQFIEVDPEAIPTAEPMPQVEIDPYLLARQILEQANLTTESNWQIALCEGEAAVLCISDGQQNVGYAELVLFPLSGYEPAYPVRQAADQLPADASAYTADDFILARQALISLAEENLGIVINDRAFTFPEDTVSSVGMEPSQMGALPALSYGFVRTNPAGEIQERYLTIAAFDQSFIYIFVITSDSANYSSFISDDVLNVFTPAFSELAAKLPVPLAQS